MPKDKTSKQLELEIIKELTTLRKKEKITQKELSNRSGVIRETIARIETNTSSPKISTMIKLLKPLGYTLKIVRL